MNESGLTSSNDPPTVSIFLRFDGVLRILDIGWIGCKQENLLEETGIVRSKCINYL